MPPSSRSRAVARLAPLAASLLFLIVACGGTTARDSLAEARQALAEARYGDTLLAVEAGFAGEPDDVTAWGLELVKLEALARAGRGDDTLAQLEKLAAARPLQVPPDQYAATADQLRAAKQGGAAVAALDQGLKRFPEDEQLAAQIEAAKAAPTPGSDELEMLKSLGYIE